jgi:tetratricopeptide (TPR) repeat protein
MTREAGNGPADAIANRALQARHDGKLEEALALCEEALRAAPEDRRLSAAMHLEMAYILRGRMKDAVRAEPHARESARLAPRSELASLNLFHTLVDLDRWEEALGEIVRFVKLRDSDAYRELLGEGFRDDLPPASRALADEARRYLRFHRAGVW